MTEVPRLEAWIGQQVSLYPREEGPEAKTIGLLRTVDDRGVILEEPGGIISFYPWMVVLRSGWASRRSNPRSRWMSRRSNPGSRGVAVACLSPVGGVGVPTGLASKAG